MKELPLRVGVLGLGQRGLQHLDVLWRLQGEGLVRVVALVDAFAENLKEEKICRFVTGFCSADVVRSTDIFETLRCVPMDALYIAIPPGRHGGEVVAAARLGVNLFVEKPVSLYVDEALEMDNAIQESGVIAVVGFQHRYDARHEVVRQFLADKRVLLVTLISHAPMEWHSVKHTFTERLGGPPNRVWTANALWSGTTLVEAGIHQTDLLRSWMGDIAWVEAHYLHRDPEDVVDGGDNPYAYSVTYGFESGALANLIVSRLRRAYFAEGYACLLWTHGAIKFEGGDVVAYTYEGEYPPRETPSREATRHVLPAPKGVDPTEAISRAFLKAVAVGDGSTLRSPFRASLNSHVAVWGANLSDLLGGERIQCREFLSDPRYAEYRRKPSSSERNDERHLPSRPNATLTGL